MLENKYIISETQRFGLEQSVLKHVVPPTYAQSAEDLIVDSILSAHVHATGRSWSSIFYIEIGANHPISTSNTYLLYSKRGCRGVLVEPNPDLHQAIQIARPDDKLIPAAIALNGENTIRLYLANAHELSSVNLDHVKSFGDFGGFGGVRGHVDVPALDINQLLFDVAEDGSIDFLSVDCEGLDYDILKSIDYEKYKPLIVQCEPSEHFISGNRDKIINLMESRSYNLVAMTDINLIFKRA